MRTCVFLPFPAGAPGFLSSASEARLGDFDRSGPLSSVVLVRTHRPQPLVVVMRIGAVGLRRIAVDQRPHIGWVALRTSCSTVNRRLPLARSMISRKRY